jgi:hypothetical protein
MVPPLPLFDHCWLLRWRLLVFAPCDVPGSASCDRAAALPRWWAEKSLRLRSTARDQSDYETHTETRAEEKVRKRLLHLLISYESIPPMAGL